MPDFPVPGHVKNAAARGLQLLEFAGDGLTTQTISEARRMADGIVSLDKAIRAAAWFARHEPDLQSPAANAYLAGDANRPTPGQVAWLLWGGQINADNRFAARDFFRRLVEREQNA